MTIDELEKLTNDFARRAKLLTENQHRTSTHVLFYSRKGDKRTATTTCMESQVESLFYFLKDRGATLITAAPLGRTIFSYNGEPEGDKTC